MRILDQLPKTATIVTPITTAGLDAMGDPLVVTVTDTAQCWLFQQTAYEDTANRDAQSDQQRLVVAYDPDLHLTGSSTVTVDGLTYALVGPPWWAYHPRTQKVNHIEATVRRTT